ncbi:MAG: hypothetical protein H6711_02120 [Myxococcales bacterium]|nr:hypothetical protein [Myxococcales bacterium]
MSAHRLGDDPPTALAPKAAALDLLARAGLPIPAGVVVDLGAPLDDAAWATIAAHVGDTPAIVRSALALEDRPEQSGAGLGRSIAGCRGREAIAAALVELRAAARAPWLRALRGRGELDEAGDQAIIQRLVDGDALMVAATGSSMATYIETYAADPDALAGAATPIFAGPLDRWPGAARGAIAALIGRAEVALAQAALDLEIVIDRRGAPWLVQARPLAAALQPGWPAFAAALADDGEALPGGWWRLDADHNPDPLSPAHAWLVAWLAAQRPSPGRPRVLAGWLFEAVEAASAGATRSHAQTQSDASASPGEIATDELDAALTHLQAQAIPAALRRLASIERSLDDPRASACAAALDHACAAMLAASDGHSALASARAGPRSPIADRERPLCLVDRARFADVLPSAWDIAAPSLAEAWGGREAGAVATPAAIEDVEIVEIARPRDRGAARWLLRELDDHLFALGLAPLRRVYLRAAEHLGIDRQRVFLLGGDELKEALEGGALADPAALARLLDARRRRADRDAGLRPPAQLFDGAPLPTPAHGHLRGLGNGAPARGPVARRRDLADLIERPPPPEAIVVLPALTAAAALVLHRLGVRALVSAHGGALSHAALMVRELGISALIGCPAALELVDGEAIQIDTRSGWLRRETSASPATR